MGKKDTWEIDLQQMTLNDLIVLEEGAASFAQGQFKGVRTVRDLLGRLVTNKTAEEIGEFPLGELSKHLDAVLESVKEIVPKESDTPS